MGIAINRPKYSFFDNQRFLFGNMWRWNPRATVLTLMRAPFIVVIPFLGIYLSRTAVLLIESGAELEQIAANIAGICAVTVACMVVLNILNGQNMYMEFINANMYQLMIMNHLISHDYEYNESPKGLSDALKALQNVASDDSGGRKAIDTASSFIANSIGLFSYAALLLIFNPLIVFVIFTTTLASYFLLRRITAWNHKNKDKWLAFDRKREHLEITSKDLAPAKDIRLYNMAGWLRSMFGVVLKQRLDWQRKEEIHGFGIDILCALLSLIREGAAYGLLAAAMFAKNLPAADFILYFGLIGGFTAWFDGLADNLYWFGRINTGFNEMREFFDHESKNNKGEGAALPEGAFSVEFRNVDYRFAGSERELFRNFNLEIKKGEKLAIVGLNGAGKTTLVKLLCGLYNPTGGAILADGKPVGAYNIEGYYSLFAAVFQDITILPLTIRQNITCETDESDDKSFRDALRFSGFDGITDKLDAGENSYLIRGLHPGAVDLSGGEMQKLALARAYYRNGKFLILDEPTAALDPIAESEVYRQYNDITAGKTSVFISHRLASTRFCDRIIFLEDGKIVEEGTHEELLAKNGKYHDLYEIQSHYYKEAADAE